MRFCKRCLYSDTHPLYITFDEDGVCSGCRVHEEKDRLDWKERGSKLRSILENYRCRSGNNYDCIIPVSGARDSHFIVHTVKNVYGMNPLLISYNKQYNTDTGIRNLANLRIKMDCDFMMLTVNPEKIRKINRATLRRFGSMYWHCIAGQTVYPVQMAVKLKIPLIIWGAHQGVDQVGMYSHLDEVEMTRKYRKEHDLMGKEAEDLIDDEFDNITERDVFEYFYPDDKEIERVGVRGIYLNNYIRWDSKAQHEQMIGQFGYESAPQTRTFDTYNDVDCFNYSDVHDYIKFLKHGYGKVVDHATREIRLKRLSREEGIELVQKYLFREPVSMDKFLQWMGITRNSLFYILNQHRSNKVWKRDEDWTWVLKDDVISLMKNTPGVESHRLEVKEPCIFELTKNKRPGYDDIKYIVIGKGYYGN
jgi:N-acetyl sugar amidotransferase